MVLVGLEVISILLQIRDDTQKLLLILENNKYSNCAPRGAVLFCIIGLRVYDTVKNLLKVMLWQCHFKRSDPQHSATAPFKSNISLAEITT